jgi:hypothetical protein
VFELTAVIRFVPQSRLFPVGDELGELNGLNELLGPDHSTIGHQNLNREKEIRSRKRALSAPEQLAQSAPG